LAGRKVFTAGEVLQAADVNDYLMDQSVMVFAGTAARGSAIPSPSEGMVTYREDDDVLEVFDGSAFNTVGGGLVAVKHALFTGTQTASLAAGAGTAVTDLTITHTLADDANKLIISAYLGAAGNSQGHSNVGIGVADDGTLIGIGDADDSRARVGAGGRVSVNTANYVVSMPSVTFVYEPNDTNEHTYTVRAINIRGNTSTLYINRTEDDSDTAARPRASSGFVIQEVAV
jgi:hypothetical protein